MDKTQDTRIGHLRERITIQQCTTEPNGYGEEIETWSTLANVWCSIAYNANTSAEDITSGRQTATTDARFQLRYRTDVTNKMRILHRTQLYDIVSITHSQDLFWTVLEAKNHQ